jgi:NifB/MoaA-like Fe-S oxidoreductase
VVTGLLTGSDLAEGLAGRDLGDRLLLPGVMLRSGDDVFLDDVRLDDLRRQISVPITILGGAADLVAACLGSDREDA